MALSVYTPKSTMPDTTTEIRGLHHVTAVATDAQANADFYVGVLGLRLVKRTVNQDAPETYHLFYADAKGNPGTDLTFFIWPDVTRGRPGAGLTVEVALAAPPGSLDAWSARLAERGARPGPIVERFGERSLAFLDPNGLALSLVEAIPTRPFTPWTGSPVGEAEQLRGFHSVRMQERSLAPTASFLEETMGFKEVAKDGPWRRFAVGGGGASRILDIEERSGAGAVGDGTVHHVAWNVGGDAEQAEFRAKVLRSGGSPTGVIDRFWFKSVYFREPGGALFEAATEGPGFLIDEEPDALGTRLILPPRFEEHRKLLEAVLPTFELPSAANGFGRGR